ncbi:MAG TPA: hypothetical protein VFP97_06210 [Chitinophagaceae bacterium]|nr:hypothetical protein [Chitinophagaceae bacterium]
MKKLSINRISISALVFIFATMLFSCQKDFSSANNQTVSEDEAASYSEESSMAEASFDDAEGIATMAADEEGNASEYGINGRGFSPSFIELRAIIGNCATITVSPNDSTYPKTIILDFGSGCLGLDGKFRSGAIVIHLTAPLRRPGSVVTITFRNYFVNRVHLEGTTIFSNLSHLPVHKWSVQVVGGRVTFPTGRGWSYQSLKVKTQVAGMDTRMVRDDVYEITGRSQTEFNSGLTITLNTETPLVKKVLCPWISDGKLKIKINDRVLFLDYGFPNNGQCDNKALLTWNNGSNHRVINL